MKTVSFQVALGPKPLTDDESLPDAAEAPPPGALSGDAPPPPVDEAPAPGDPREYIAKARDYRTTHIPDERITFTFRVYGTPASDVLVQMREHEIAGGLKSFLDLMAAVEKYEELVRAQVNEKAWPKGRPEDLSPREITQAFDQAYSDHDSSERRALFELRSMSDRISFLAAWPTLIVDPPEGWADLSEKEIPFTAVMWIRRAWLDATEASTQGNGRSSAR